MMMITLSNVFIFPQMHYSSTKKTTKNHLDVCLEFCFMILNFPKFNHIPIFIDNITIQYNLQGLKVAKKTLRD